MNYPENLKKGDTIGICAPSDGIADADKIKKLEKAESALKELGYNIVETKSVRMSSRGRSASGEIRAKEFMELLENDKIKMMLFATGGDLLCEMLDYLDFEKIKKLKPKWMQGYSDITGISFLFNTICEIPSMYCQTIKDYAMKPLHKSLVDALKIQSGNIVKQESFDLYEKECFPDDFENENYLYNLTEKVEWKNIFGEDKIVMQGRALGGCLDIIVELMGTKYDNVKNYMEKYKNDGIIWFFDPYEMPTSQLFRYLWKMKNAGYFKYCNGIIIGRPLFIRDDYDITFNETVKDALKDLKIPVICDADIGHVSPQLAIVNGSIVKITNEKGRGIVETFFK